MKCHGTFIQELTMTGLALDWSPNISLGESEFLYRVMQLYYNSFSRNVVFVYIFKIRTLWNSNEYAMKRSQSVYFYELYFNYAF